MRTLPFQIDQAALAVLCRRRNVKRLSVFGSALRDDFTAASDIDMLVEFQPGRAPGLGFFILQDELSKLVGRKVDLNTVAELGTAFRDEVLKRAEPIYGEA